MSLSVTVLGESHCFSDFPGPAGVPAENSSRVRSTAARWGNHTPACAGGTVADITSLTSIPSGGVVIYDLYHI